MVDTQQKTFITETNDVCRTTKQSKEESGNTKRRRRRKLKNPIPYSMREYPELNHPSLTRGQKKFLGSIATVYSTENMKRSIEEQYVRQLLYEKDKGIIKGADWYKYLDYFCQSSKRKHLFQPSTLPSRSVKNRKLRTRADIHRPILAPLPPIPSSVSQNIRSSKRSSLANSQNPATPRYVTTIRRNESIPDVSFKNDPIETNITVIGDEDSHKSSQTLSTVSTSKDSSEITETTLTFPSEVSKDTSEKDAIQDDSTTDLKADHDSQTDDQNKPEVNEIATNDEKEKKDDDKETLKTNSSESSKKIEENEIVENCSSDKESVDDVESSGETVIEKTRNEEEEITPNSHEKYKDDAAAVQDDEQNSRKSSVSSYNETSTNDEMAEKATSSRKETSDDGAEVSVEKEEDEDASLGEPTTDLLTLLGQSDEDPAPLQGEGITRPKSRIGNRPTRSPV